jgi:hypothetical protein
MRWNWRDYGVGLLVVILAMMAGLPAGPLGLVFLLPGVPRETVEKHLGQPSETVSYVYYCDFRDPQWMRGKTLPAGSHRYSHPLGTITVEYIYRGYPDQRVNSFDIDPKLTLEGVVHMLPLPLVLVTAARLCRFVRHKFDSGTTPTTA